MTHTAHVKLVTAICIGDSITAGQYVEPARRWTKLIADRFDHKYRATAVHVAITPRAVSGDTTREGLIRFGTDVQALSPDVVTIQFGMNDANCWLTDRGLPRVSEAAFRANLSEMVMRARHFGARRIILLSNHRSLRRKMMLNGQTFEQVNARYSEIIGCMAAETNTVFCDVRAAFASFGDSDLERLLLPYPDHIHLSPEGHCVYADAVWPTFDAAVKAVLEDSKARAAA